MRSKNTPRIFLSALLATVLYASPARARDPYIIDDAGIADKGVIQSTNWFSHSNHGEDLANTALAYQLFNNLETTVRATRDIGNGGDNTLFTLQEKYQWHNAPAWQSSFVGGLTYDTAQQEFAGGYAYIPVTYALTSVLSLNVNVGWQYLHPDAQSLMNWGANIAWQATRTISFTAEEFGASSGVPGQQLGIGWQPERQPFAVDLVYGHNITGTDGQWLTTALTLSL